MKIKIRQNYYYFIDIILLKCSSKFYENTINSQDLHFTVNLKLFVLAEPSDLERKAGQNDEAVFQFVPTTTDGDCSIKLSTSVVDFSQVKKYTISYMYTIYSKFLKSKLVWYSNTGQRLFFKPSGF